MSLQYLINKNRGKATTNEANAVQEESFNSTSTTPIRNQDVWYDLDLIPIVAPGANVGVVKYHSAVPMVLVPGARSQAFQVANNDLVNACYGVNGANYSYDPVVILPSTGRQIGTTEYLLDTGSGFLTFHKIPPEIVLGNPVTYPTISYHSYIGRRGVPVIPNVFNNTSNLNTTGAILQLPITSPSIFVYYVSLVNAAKTSYRSGYLNITASTRIATVTENSRDGAGTIMTSADLTATGITFGCTVINNVFYLLTNISSDSWTISIKPANLIQTGTNTTYTGMGADTSASSYTIRSWDRSVLGVHAYYLIYETANGSNPGLNDVRAGQLDLFWTDPTVTTPPDHDIKEIIFPIIGDNSLASGSNPGGGGNVNFSLSASGTDQQLSLNFPATLYAPFTSGKRYTVKLYEFVYDSATVLSIPAAVSTLVLTIPAIDRASTNYLNYHYLLTDSETPALNGNDVTVGEATVIWDNITSGLTGGIFADNTTQPNIGDNAGLLNSTSVSFGASYASASSVQVTITVPSTANRSYNLYLFTDSITPVLFLPQAPPTINEYTNASVSGSPYVLEKINNLNTTGVYINYCLINSKGTAKQTGAFLASFSRTPPATATPPGAGDISVSNVDIVELGDVRDGFGNLKSYVDFAWTGISPELRLVVLDNNQWQVSYQIIDLANNYTIASTAPPGLTTILDNVYVSDSGAYYYYMIQTSDGLNVQLGDILLSYDGTVAFNPNLLVISQRYASSSSNPLSNPSGTIGDTSAINFNLTYTSGGFAQLTVLNTDTVTSYQIFLYKVSCRSTTVAPDLNTVAKIRYSPGNIASTKSWYSGDNVLIKALTGASVNHVIGSFSETETTIPKFSTSTNVLRAPEQITNYTLQYVLGNNNDYMRTGELQLDFISNNVYVKDRRTYSGTRVPDYGTFLEPTFDLQNYVLQTNSGNQNQYNLVLTTYDGISYDLQLSVGLVLSNFQSPKLHQISYINGPSLVRNYDSRYQDGVSLFYILTSNDGSTPTRRRIGVANLTWTDPGSVVVNDVFGTDLFDTSGFAFEASYTGNTIALSANIAGGYPVSWVLSWEERYL